MLYRERKQVRSLYMGFLLLTTALALFACCWLALNLSKQVTRPVESLADAMEAIAAGDYGHRVGQSSTEELGELVDSFNVMAADLESAHATAERSTAQLSDLNQALQARRTELETIIETIPTGVVTLSADRRILLANRAFSEMLDPGGQRQFIGLPLSAVLPADIVDALDHLLRRTHRMGSASAEMQMQSGAGILHLAATVALLEGRPSAVPNLAASSLRHEHLGYVLVLEDATELLRAQKQSAWKEVARRVAHEIKNPLTPISLNAELIGRHIARLNALLTEHSLESPSPAVIQRSTEVISSSVETMRSLVDQFSSLAEFPTARPRPSDLNTIVENSLALFAGRLGNIRVSQSLAPNLPLVLADPEALKRALSNLIDNAAEAMQDSLLRELHISTRLLARSRHPESNSPSPTPAPASPTRCARASSSPTSPPSSAAPASASPSPPRSSRNTTAPSAPKKTSPPAPASSSNSAPPPTPPTPHPPPHPPPKLPSKPNKSSPSPTLHYSLLTTLYSLPL